MYNIENENAEEHKFKQINVNDIIEVNCENKSIISIFNFYY
jgi:hypothetical protein